MATKDFKIYVNCPLPTKKTTKDFKIIVGELNKASVESIVKIAVKSELRKDVYVKVKDPAKKTYTIVYNPNEKTFISNGLAILDNELIRCEVQEVLNGLYNLELEYPINNKNVDYLIEGNIIKTNTPSGEQPFRIYRTIKNLDTVIVYANHIFFDLQSNFLMDCRYKFATGQQALEDILKSTLYENNFTCDSNIIERNNAYYIRKNPVEAILTEENSIINLYKGELLRDKFKIIINDSIGKDNNDIEITNSTEIVSPILVESSKPLITVFGTGDIDLTINNKKVQLEKIDGSITIDSSIKECYKEKENLSYRMIGEFPKLIRGKNTININGNIEKIIIKPNWRCL